MPQKCIEGSCRKRPLSVETLREYVAENPLTEPEGLLLRGSATMRGFARCLDHSLEWLERFSPGVGARFRGATLKRWRRNTAAVRAWPRCRHAHGDGLQCGAPMMSVCSAHAASSQAADRIVPGPCTARDRPTATASETIEQTAVQGHKQIQRGAVPQLRNDGQRCLPHPMVARRPLGAGAP